VTRLGYLVGRYPAASHAFLLREVGALRRAGAEVETITIRSPRSEELLTEADRDAARTTYRVLPAGPLKLLAAHVPAFFSHTLRYLRTLGYAIEIGRGLRGRLWQLFYFAEAIVVWRHCRRRGLSRLHAHFADTATDSALLVTHFEPQWRWSISVHGPDEFAEADQNRLAEKLAAAEFIVAVSDDARGKAEQALAPGDRGKIHRIRMGVDLERFAPSAEPRGGDEAVSVLCLGRLVERKGHRFLLEAIAGLDGIELVIAGDGPERESLDALAENLGVANRVRFAGVVGQDEALDLYHRADVFCLPSLAEGLPTVLIEAMACGVPVVSTRIDGVPELVTDGEDGLLCEAGDPGALASRLRRLAADPAERQRLSRAGRAKVERLHDLERQAAALLALFSGPGDPLSAKPGRVGELPDAEQSKA
jgi:colanic acid/amylovoran biosynthesis glycosyltransferase